MKCLIFIENELITPNQLKFKPSINQMRFKLLHKSTFSYYSYDIYESFDDGLKVSGVLLDIWKAYDKVWHEHLIFKLKQNGTSGNLLNLSCDFLRNRKQRVLLNGQVSDWSDVRAGVPQGSILDPLLF